MKAPKFDGDNNKNQEDKGVARETGDQFQVVKPASDQRLTKDDQKQSVNGLVNLEPRLLNVQSHHVYAAGDGPEVRMAPFGRLYETVKFVIGWQSYRVTPPGKALSSGRIKRIGPSIGAQRLVQKFSLVCHRFGQFIV